MYANICNLYYRLLKTCAALLLLLLLVNSGIFAQQPIVNDSSSIIYSGLQPAEAVIKLFKNLAVHSFSKSNQVNFGLTGSEYHYLFIKLSAANALSNQCISIDNTSIDTIMIYRVFPGGKAQLLYQGGALMPYKNKHYNWHTAAVEIGIAPSYYLIATKASQKNINYQYQLFDKDTLQSNYEAYNKYVFSYCGVIVMMLSIVIIAFFLFHRFEFGLYAAYIICFSSWVLAHYGRIFPALYPETPVFNLVIKPVTSLGAGLLLIAVLRLVFLQQLRQQHPRVLQCIGIILYGMGTLIVCMLLFLLPHPNAALNNALIIAWHIGLIISIIVVLFLPLLFFTTNKTARIFLIAVTVVALMASVQIIATLGYISNFFINEHGMAVGSLLEISIMACGLFYSLLEQMKEKEKHLLALEQEQTDTLKKLITVKDNERKRIAADLHDNLGPLLAALKINFRRIIQRPANLQEDLADKTEAIIDDAIAEIRNVAHNLMPKGLSSNGLINTLNEYFENTQQLYSKNILFTHHVSEQLNAELQTNLYRIICELVLNAARHSKAAFINVHIQCSKGKVTLSVYDDGQGFIKQQQQAKQTLGLQSAESRVHYLKGAFSLQTQNGKGTIIDIEIPVTV